MLLQFKIYMISVLYTFGVIFMIVFPPRNFELSGAKMRIARSIGEKLQLKSYLSYQGTMEKMHRITRNDSEVATLVTLSPTTTENRSILALELHSDKNSKKPGILVIGALNSMVWAAPNVILELAEKLLYDSNFQTPYFNDYDWYLVPMANPDGIQFTKDLQKFPPVDTNMWCHNHTARIGRRPNLWFKNTDKDNSLDEDSCFGTNVNRNFAYHWQDDVQKTPDLCSQYYPGIRPFSSNEAQAIRKYVDKLNDVIQLAIHVHASFVPKKELIVYPWRYTTRQPSNYKTLQAIGEYAARRSRLPDGRLYEVHQSSSDDRVAGSLSDYISGVVGTELVFLIKPYHQPFPNFTDVDGLETYVNKGITAILSLVRGWRSSTKLNTLSFFGKDIEF